MENKKPEYYNQKNNGKERGKQIRAATDGLCINGGKIHLVKLLDVLWL